MWNKMGFFFLFILHSEISVSAFYLQATLIISYSISYCKINVFWTLLIQHIIWLGYLYWIMLTPLTLSSREILGVMLQIATTPCSYNYGCVGAIKCPDLSYSNRRGRKPALILKFEEECANFTRQVWLCCCWCGNKYLTYTSAFNVGRCYITCQPHYQRNFIAQVSVLFFTFEQRKDR